MRIAFTTATTITTLLIVHLQCVRHCAGAFMYILPNVCSSLTVMVTPYFSEETGAERCPKVIGSKWYLSPKPCSFYNFRPGICSAISPAIFHCPFYWGRLHCCSVVPEGQLPFSGFPLSPRFPAGFSPSAQPLGSLGWFPWVALVYPNPVPHPHSRWQSRKPHGLAQWSLDRKETMCICIR